MSQHPNPMIPDINELFCQAIEQPSSELRDRFLQELERESPEARKRLDELLSAHFSSGSLLDTPNHLPQEAAATLDLQTIARPGNLVGPYKLLEEIGRGGMGVVYMAEQTEPVRRKVALKIIIPGLDSAQVLARFEAERQALALMDHPNIARVLDAGTTREGRPYFVMELVKGVTISNYCDQHRLDLRQRLELFVPVCYAIQHAHQKGIIHRDIKPSNVLVASFDGRPVPKVIDFGVAKAIGSQLTHRTLFTGFGSVIGTLEYMSPEQAEFNALDVDTRSDIYSLGVLLYELLTGVTPVTAEQMNHAGLIEALRVIREQEPQPPSTRLSSSAAIASVAATRGTEPLALMRSLRGELDWIALRALEKDRNRRYESATALANDIGRFLADEKVEACPPSTLYALRKFCRRNRTAIITASAFVGLLVIGAALSLSLAIVAERERDRAMLASRIAENERLVAEQDRQRALSAEAAAERNASEATAQSERAQANAAELRRQMYAADMIRTEIAFKRGDMNAVRSQLKRHIPSPGESDPRGFEWFYLNHRSSRELLTVTRESSPVRRVCFAAGGKELVAAADGGVEVLDSSSGQHSRTLAQFERKVTSLELSPSQDVLAIATDNGELILCRVSDGQTLKKIQAHTNEPEAGISSLAFGSTDGRIITGDRNGHVKFWDVNTGEQWRPALDIKRWIRSLDWSRDENSLVIGCDAGQVELWKLDQEKPVYEFQDSGWNVTRVAFHPSEDTFSASTGRSVKFWNAASGEELKSVDCFEAIEDFQFSPDGKSIATHNGYRAIDVWDCSDTPASINRHLNRFEGHSGNINAFAFSPDSQRLASCSGESFLGYFSDCSIRLWNLDAHAEPMSIFAYSFCVKFSPDSKLFGSFDFGGNPTLFDAATGKPVRTLERAAEATQSYAIAFDPHGRFVASGAETVTISSLSDGSVVEHLRPDVHWLRKLEFSPDGKFLAVSGYKGMCIYRSANWEKIDKLRLATGAFCTSYSSDSKWLAVTTHNSLIVWDLAANTIAKEIKLSVDEVRAVDFHPGGRELAIGCSDGTIMRWSAGDWRLLSTWKAHLGSVSDLAYNSVGSRIVSGSFDGTAYVWDVVSSGYLLTLDGHSIVVAVDFSGDDQRIATAGFDGSVKVWNAPKDHRQSALQEVARGVDGQPR